jgi:Lon protease-like protein
VVAHYPLPDGRCNIVLQHVGTVEFVQELPTSKAYRCVRAKLLPEVPAMDLSASSQRIKALMWQLAALHPAAVEPSTQLSILNGAQFLDALAPRVLSDVERRVDYLAAHSWAEKVALLEDSLATYLSMGYAAADA